MSDVLAKIKTGRWLDEQTFPPLSWAVPGLIPEGFGLFTGPPKVGKSWASLDIVLAVAAGGHALGKVNVGPARPVLLLALEDGDRRLQERCRELLKGEPIPERLHYVTEATGAEALALIEAWLESHGGQRPLVVLDTLGKVMPPALPGEGAYARDYRVGSRLKGLVDAHPGSALLVVHHVRKAGSEDWMDSTSGTNGLNGAADFTVALTRPRNETEGTLKVTGRDVPEGEYAVTVEGGQWTLRGASLADAARQAEQTRATAGLGDRSAEIVAFVAQHSSGVRAKDVAAAMPGVTEKDAGTYLLRAERAGRIVRLARGLYGPTPAVGSVGSVVNTDGESYTSHTSYTACHGCGEPLDHWLLDNGVSECGSCGGAS